MLTSLSELFTTTEDGFTYPVNAASLFDDSELSTIALKVKSDYDLDLTTCERKFEHLNEIMELAMIITRAKSYPWNNSSNIVYPLIANAAINFGSSCYPEIIQDNEVVKAKVIGSDDGRIAKFNGQIQMSPEGEPIRQGAGDKLRKGNRVATMMNWQLLEQMPWWENDIDKEVHSLPILGTLYKKVYYDPLRKMPVSELIFPNRIVINNSARDIDSAIVTQIIELYPQEILERIRSGFYVNFDFDVTDAMNSTTGADANTQVNLPRTEQNRDPKTNTNLHQFLEQHTWLDLDEDGFLEPYIVTVHYESSKCVRIIPRFEEKDITYNDKNEIQEIKACKYFVVRRFLPSFDGSFMGIGFGHLLFNMNNAINTTLNQMVDAGHLSITGGGFIAKNVKIRGGKISLSPNEYRLVDVTGPDLASSIYPMPRPEPSPVLFTLLGSLIEAGKDLGSMRDLINGEVASNVAPTTMISLVEQGMKQYKSIYKRYHKSLKTEFGLLYDLNSKYLTNDEYAAILDQDEDEVDVKGDFDEKAYDIVPVADVNAINSTQKFAQASFLMQFRDDPFVNGYKLRKNIFNTARIPETDDLVIMPQPAPDPAQILAEAEKIKAEAKAQEIEIKVSDTMGKLEKMKYEIANLEADVEVKKTSAMKTLAEAMQIEKEAHLNALSTAAEAIRKSIETEADIRLREKEHELAKQSAARESQMAEAAPAEQAVS